MSREHEVFQQWSDMVNKEFRSSKYLYKERDVMLEELVSMLQNWSVGLDESISLKSKVRNFLVTDEGKKNKGKHKGWQDTVETNFVAAIMRAYQPTNVPANIIQQSLSPSIPEYGKGGYILQEAFITAWAQDRFGIAWNEKLNLECHKHNGTLMNDFRKEVLDTEWCRTGQNAPEWYNKLVA